MTTALAQFNQLSTLDHEHLAHDAASLLPKMAEELVEWVLQVDPQNFQLMDQLKEAVLALGSAEQTAYWQLNGRLIGPLQQLMADTEAGGKVAGLLQQLQRAVANMRPPNKRPSWKERFLLLFSWRESAYQMWLDNFPKQQANVNRWVGKLKEEQKQLRRDNVILSGDHEALSEALQRLTHCFDFINHLEPVLQKRLTAMQDVDMCSMLQDELMGPVQQRLLELQQQLLIARQAVMTVELILKQNKTLIRDIDQTVMTTTAALDVAAGIAMAKHHQHQHKKAVRIDTEKLMQAKSTIETTLAHLNEVNQEVIDASDALDTSHFKDG